MAVNSDVVYLISRDLRTHTLFRDAWLEAVVSSGRKGVPVLRFDQKFGLLGAILRFIRCSLSRRIIFGSSEILLYALLSSRKDIWVFTGLGRLLDGSRPLLSIFLLFYLRCVHRGQRLICLNCDDFLLVKSRIDGNSFLLPGEGYKFFVDTDSGSSYSEGLIFAYVGRLLYSKGLDRILEVYSNCSRISDVLLLYGDFDFKNSDSISLSLIKQYQEKSTGKIVIMGFTEDVRDSLKGVDTVISMSRREGLPFSILDAISAGCNVVLTRVPGHNEFLGLDGVTFVETNEDLVEIFSKRGSLKRLSISRQNCRRDVARMRFGYERVVSILKTYIR
jgi:glycosyltransferase involved in cell wall biosynthesis